MRFATVAIAVLTAAIFGYSRAGAAEKADKADEPPVGIIATSSTLGAVLRAHVASSGTSALPASASREEWALDEAGRTGSETIVRRGNDYHSVLQRFGAHEEYGKLGDAAWHLDANGIVTPTTHDDEDSFSMQRVLEAANDPKNDVKLLGTTTAPDAYVVEVRYPGNKHPQWMFFDRVTGRVIRTERVVQNDRLIETFDDYRVENGVARPWHVLDTFKVSGLAFDYTLRLRTTGVPTIDADFTAPSGRFTASQVTTAEIVPSSIKFLSVIVRLMIGGRGLDFELSSGNKRSYIDRNIALELGLPTFGQPVKTKNGRPLGFDTVIAEGTVGSIAVRDFAVRAVDIAYEPSSDTKIVGILGSDFLRSGIFTIDFVNQQVMVAANDSPPPIGDAETVVLPVRFDDGQPFISATISGHGTAHAQLDNAFPFTTIIGSFTAKYPDSVPDDHGKARHAGNLPFADNQRYGRSGTVWISKVASLNLADLKLLDYRVLATDMGADDRMEAIVGMNLLQYFDVRLDYGHGRIVLRKNKYFHQLFAAAK